MSRRTKLFIVTGGILFFVIVIGVFIFTHQKKDDIKPIDSSIVIPYLKDGDIILRQGDGPWSPAFRDMSLTDKRFSHLGIVRIHDGNISIINSVGYLTNNKKGVEEKTLEEFLSVARISGVFRANFTEGSKISDKAVEYVNYPFDWDFDLEDDSQIYCTELLYAILKYYALENYLTTIYVEKIKKEIVPLDSISNSAAFDEIIYFK
jgi:hypothetical protein